MRLTEFLDKGASLGPDRPCFVTGDQVLSYGALQALTHRVARALAASGVRPGDKVAVLSANDPLAFACVFGIARAGAVWCPINPRNEAAENRHVLDAFDCAFLIWQGAFAPLVQAIAPGLPKLRGHIRFDTPEFEQWLGDPAAFDIAPPDDLTMVVGTGGTTGLPKGVMLSGHNLETMSAATLIGYPFQGRPTYLALAPLTHAAGVLALPVMLLGGAIVIMPKPDLAAFVALIARHRVTHTFLPPTLIYALLDHPALADADLSSLQCFWYGAAPISTARLAEALRRLGPMAQLFGQTEAPMMISTMAPSDHYQNGAVAERRLASAGRPSPLTQVAIMDNDGALLPSGAHGEIVVRGPLVMLGYYKDAAATAEAGLHGWHHTGDIGFLDDDGYLFIVDRAKDMIITGGFNVYSVEVEQALMRHPAVRDAAVIGLPDPKWGERVEAVVQLIDGGAADTKELAAFARTHLGGVKAPKAVHIWPDLPRSKVGKVVKKEIKARLLEES